MANDIQVTVQEQDVFTISTTLVNPTTVAAVSDIGDVDVTTNGKIDGSVLVYKAATNKWTATKLLNQQNLDAGEF